MHQEGSNRPDPRSPSPRDEALYQALKEVLTLSDEEVAGRIAASPEMQKRRAAIEARSKGRQGETLIFPVKRRR